VSAVLGLLVEPFTFEFMRNALWVTATASVVCAVISCWLVLIGWSLLGDAVSHAVLPGVVLSYLVGAPFAVGALVFGLGAVALIGLVRATSRTKEDAATGVVFTTLFALGLVLVSLVPSQTDLQHILFGNLLGVGPGDVVQVVGLGLVVLAALVVKRRDLTLYAFDRTHAHAIGLKPRHLGALLLTALALTTVVALQAVGVVLVVAMLITPGAAAYLLTDRLERMLLIAPAIALACAVAGLYTSYYADVSSGGAIVVWQGAAFALAYLFAPRHGVLTQAVQRRGQRRRAARGAPGSAAGGTTTREAVTTGG
jgi:manganese transport system permease protein